MNTLIIHQDKSNQQFLAETNGQVSTLDYERPHENMIDFKATYVPENMREKGVGSKLVAQGLRFAQEEKLKVKATCPFVKEYVEKNPEFKEMTTD